MLAGVAGALVDHLADVGLLIEDLVDIAAIDEATWVIFSCFRDPLFGGDSTLAQFLG